MKKYNLIVAGGALSDGMFTEIRQCCDTYLNGIDLLNRDVFLIRHVIKCT